MTRLFAAFVVFLFTLPNILTAQDDGRAWVQIEAHPNLATAEARARAYAVRMNDVNGFVLGGGWYGIALGPYDPDFAEAVLRELRADREIPSDSYIESTSRYRQAFYPIGSTVLNDGVVTAPRTTETATAATAPLPEPEPADETPREARRSESRLDRDERRLLQIALKWAGFYDAAIDGAFGRGTRGSMAAWQGENGYETTGVLTTKQRAELLRQYNAVLDGMGLVLVSDTDAGIEMQIPTDVVRKGAIEYPFAHYDGTGKVEGAKLLLISQAGDQSTLFGLYDILQTLEIVPLEGPRERGDDSFTITGTNDQIVSYTEASLKGGTVKGFTLIWPAGDEERRTRVLDEMRKDFARIDGVIDPTNSGNTEQAIDLVAGLEIRQPRLSRSGFFVNDTGAVVTTTEVISQCSRLTLDRDQEARVVAQDDTLGIAVLRPTSDMAPITVAELLNGVPRLKSEVASAGYSYGGVLNAPTLTHGFLADVKGLRGEPELRRLALAAQDGDAGGPVLDVSGAVIGMLLPRPKGEQQLPAEVSFATEVGGVRALLNKAGIGARSHNGGSSLNPVDLTKQATGMTTLVSCWE